MGYFTRYSLQIDDLRTKNNEKDLDISSIIDSFRKKYENASYALDENGDSDNESKWYEHNKDLVAFSKKNKDILFTLSGIGEENPDLWKLYVINGKSQKAKAVITYDDFSFDKTS